MGYQRDNSMSDARFICDTVEDLANLPRCSMGCLYDGQNYTNTSGMTPSIDSTHIGIQINSSSRFEAHGGVLPCTITFTNFRYEKL